MIDVAGKSANTCVVFLGQRCPVSAPRNNNAARERHWVCAKRLRERRLALGLTQRELAMRLTRHGNLISNRALSDMENGRGLDLGLLPELAEALDCTVTFLLGLTSDPCRWQPENGTNGHETVDRPHRTEWPLADVSGVLGPEVPAGFTAPARSRRRGTPSPPA